MSGPNQSHQTDPSPLPQKESAASKKPTIAIVISTVSLVASAVGLYFSALAPPSIAISRGSEMKLSLQDKKPIIGMLLNFTNTGVRPTTITKVQVQWDNPDVTFTADFVSPYSEEWYYDEEGKRQVSRRFTYTYFGPLPLQGNQNTGGFYWFSSTEERFEFTAGVHHPKIQVFGHEGRLGEAQLQLNVLEGMSRESKELERYVPISP